MPLYALVQRGACLLLTVLFISSNLAHALSQETEEVGYDDLVKKLSKKTQSFHLPSFSKNEMDSQFDNLKIHTNFSYISSMNSVSTNNNSDLHSQDGFQLGVGIDLFSQHLSAMGMLRNFGQRQSGNSTQSIREFDLEMVYRETNYHLAAGLGTRYYKLQDSTQKLNVSDSTPVTVLAAGIDAPITPDLGLNIEMGWRTAIVTNTADKNSVDLTVGLDARF